MKLERCEDRAGSPVPASLLDEAETLTGALATLVDGFPDFRCLTSIDRHGVEQVRTLSEIWQRALVVRHTLVERDIRPGDVVILIHQTGPELVSAYFGVLLAGGVPGLVATPSNRVADHDVYARRVGAILANASAHSLYCDAEIVKTFHTRPELLGGSLLLGPDDIARAGHDDRYAPRGDDVATIQYSSGSTGTPKGVLLSHRAMLNNIRAVRTGLGLTSADTSVNWIPLYHDMGLIDAFLLPVLSGCPTVLIPTMDFMRDPGLWLWAVHRYRGAISWAPNFAYHVAAHRIPEAELEGLDLSSWRIAINAAESVQAATMATFTERFGPHGFRPEAMTPAWGLAENVTIATAHPIDEAPRVEHIDREKLATDAVAELVAPSEGLPSIAIGRCLPQCRVEIRNDAREALPDRQVGTIWLHSDSLLDRYHDAPEATAEVLVDGWLDTGDLGYVADGDLFFVSRDKDLIVIGGEKYAPHDIEALINQVPGVRAGCAVAFSIPSEAAGTEDLAAVVETRETGDDADALDRALRDSVLRSTGIPLRHLVLVPPGGVEKTTSGKLARRATRDRHADRLI